MWGQGPEPLNMDGKGLVASVAMKVGGMQCLVITTHYVPLVPAVSPSWDYTAFFHIWLWPSDLVMQVRVLWLQTSVRVVLSGNREKDLLPAQGLIQSSYQVACSYPASLLPFYAPLRA